MLSHDHPLHAKFTRLTQQEDSHGLLSDSSTVSGPETVELYAWQNSASHIEDAV